MTEYTCAAPRVQELNHTDLQKVSLRSFTRLLPQEVNLLPNDRYVLNQLLYLGQKYSDIEFAQKKMASYFRFKGFGPKCEKSIRNILNRLEKKGIIRTYRPTPAERRSEGKRNRYVILKGWLTERLTSLLTSDTGDPPYNDTGVPIRTFKSSNNKSKGGFFNEELFRESQRALKAPPHEKAIEYAIKETLAGLEAGRVPYPMAYAASIAKRQHSHFSELDAGKDKGNRINRNIMQHIKNVVGTIGRKLDTRPKDRFHKFGVNGAKYSWQQEQAWKMAMEAENEEKRRQEAELAEERERKWEAEQGDYG